MNLVMDGLVAVLLLAGAFFYLAGTVGLIRFPDALSRMHALTKADNLGLLCICAAAALLAGGLRPALLLLLVWLLALLAATVSAHLIARVARADRGGAESEDAP
ncbi:monovalent cation/H(+) antiporter subunit G [Halorhodospira sp. 9621]|uniref:monovalent cation/H(+) antiporter subunit G n=1 Tax=Halorhodospira TaxID=85108 RepID=UPI001EE82737|nr:MULTISPECIES: monovalent cation/H(+) antiporter subunit G [Halorhodospira]MCG5529061.1 monovalent cation/H(+) antiporter subunit G [Halorhodospira halophila]MCG5534155.1 monovalent cation/H(+) antiporter subunit G [Halorhodospira sp. 9621]MCG5543176.1 monovalent cation/H(+) antiporter subunit G [Halorhodospira sp. 9628]